MPKESKSSMKKWIPRPIDEYATEVEEGFVQIEGIEKLIPLEAYLENKEKDEKELVLSEKRFGNEVRVYIRDYLREKGHLDLTFQEGCRQLSYSLTDLPKIEGAPFCSGLPDLLPDAYHQEHIIRAVLSVKRKLPLTLSGRVPSYYATCASSHEQRNRERVRMWKALYSLIEKDLKDENGETKCSQVRGKSRNIYHEIDELKSMMRQVLDHLKGSEGT